MSLWLGEKVTSEEFWKNFKSKQEQKEFWSRPPISHTIFYKALEDMIAELSKQKSNLRQTLKKDLMSQSGMTDWSAEESFKSLIEFMTPWNLRTKLTRELGTDFPFELKRIDPREPHFECWNPMGTLVHITPNNSPLLNVFATIEGLLSGNVNLLKLGRKDTLFAEIFFEALSKMDPTGHLKNYIFIETLSAREKEKLKDFLSVGDVVSAWGSEEAIASLRQLTPEHARFIDWGHKISFAYMTKSIWHNRTDKKYSETQTLLVREMLLNEQQSCSSPQVLYLEDANFEDLKNFAKDLSVLLDKACAENPLADLSDDDAAELTTQTEQVRLAEVLEHSALLESKNKQWRIYIETNSSLRTSPLFRTLWIKPIQRNEILSHFSGLKKYLQTFGLSANRSEQMDLIPLFFQSGLLRIKPLGQMTDGYNGEPHDGVSALQRFCKKVSYSDADSFNGFMSIG